LDEANPSSGPRVDTQLRDPLADRRHVAHQAVPQACDTRNNDSSDLRLFERFKPLRELGQRSDGKQRLL
jgi:hypothetical protein